MTANVTKTKPLLEPLLGVRCRQWRWGMVHGLRCWRFWLGLAALAGAVLARVYCAGIYRVDSDEPQHLHVVWGVARGMVQYRDLFDNHSPLFALLASPFFQALGVRAEIVPQMRMGMIPFYFGCIGWVYLLGARLFSRRCGIWAALVTALHPRFFATSLEFRPDSCWAFCWLALLVALVCVRRPGVRLLLMGGLLGTAFAVSMKTAVMALDLAAAGGVTWALAGFPRPKWAVLVRGAGLFSVGVTLVPGWLLFRFYREGALGDMGYCLIRHNLVAVAERHHFLDLRAVVVLSVFGVVFWWSRRLIAEGSPMALKRGFVMVAGGLYPVLLLVGWPLVTREDFLPLVPLVALVLVAGFLALWKPAGWGGAWTLNLILGGTLAVLVGMDCRAVRPWQDRSRFQARFLANVLKLTEAGDAVLDTKGEMIYRRRPCYFVFEEMTRWSFKRKALRDDVPECVAERRVCVATDNYGRFPVRTKRFVKRNFIPVAFRTLVAGKMIRPSGLVAFFDIAIPACYALIPEKQGAVLLDGQLCAGSVWLRPGRHFISAAAGSGAVAVVWARAVELGFDPFYKPSREEREEARRSGFDNIM